MRLGEILVGRRIVTLKELYAALDIQKRDGGRLGDILVSLNLLTAEQFTSVLAAVTQATPAPPRTLEDTGIASSRLFNLMIKFMHFQSRQTVSDLAKAMKLPYAIVRPLMDEATQRSAVQPLGSGNGGGYNEIRYTLSAEGRKMLAEACEQNLYLGPAPVPLNAFRQQVEKQLVSNEIITADHLRQGLRDLALPERYVRKLLPAINTGRSVLMYGPPGNGKTTIASRFAALLDQMVCIPYAVEADGEIIKIYDHGMHRPAVPAADRATIDEMESVMESFDDRWVACRRPFAMVGGELTLEMLELRYDPKTKLYDAPQHVKALNGVFLIDDFGRQQIKPTELLNRWIVPMENRIDYLRLQNGYVFSLPFDALLVFSTNIEPEAVMDAAQLRRIPYKIKIDGPNVGEYRNAFEKQASAYQLEIGHGVFDYVVDVLSVSGQYGLALFQPRFICEQVSEICKAFGLPRTLTADLATEALGNLYVQLDNRANR
jgi:MoxR-like ATPase